MALSKTARTLVASAANTASSTTRGTLDLNSKYGGTLSIKMTNGGTGPTIQCQANVLVAHNASLPTAASAGTDWKTMTSIGGGTANNGITELVIPIPASTMCLEVEFTGNTGQSVTVESYFSELTSPF